MKNIDTSEKFNNFIKNNTVVLAYFSHNKCNVCKILKPKLDNYFSSNYPKLELIYINVTKLPKLSAQKSIFTVPVVIIFFKGKEFYRKARNFSIPELAELINRPYSMIFNS